MKAAIFGLILRKTVIGILDAKIGGLPEGFDKDSFNVVVIQECTPVAYDEAGNPTADWSTVYTDYKDAASGEGDGVQ